MFGLRFISDQFGAQHSILLWSETTKFVFGEINKVNREGLVGPKKNRLLTDFKRKRRRKTAVRMRRRGGEF